MTAPAPSRWRIDVSPLRTSRDFRLLFSAGVITYLGSMFTFVAVPLQAQQLTGSFVVVGLLGLVEVVPIIVFGLWGGAVADHYDRRRVIIAAEVGSALCAVLLLVNALQSEPRVWVLFVVGALAATAESIQRPSLEALVPQTVGARPARRRGRADVAALERRVHLRHGDRRRRREHVRCRDRLCGRRA